MKTTLLIILITVSLTKLYSQSNNYIDSLKTDTGNSVIIFEDNCNGCIVMNSPCSEYTNSGNPKDKYIIWKNNKGFHIKRFNVCGSSNTLTFKKWKNNPFDYIESKAIELDATKLLYPLSLDRNDSTWFETGINHYKYFAFSFVTYDIQDINIKEYAFRKPKEDDEIWADLEIEFEKNQYRYNYNNDTAIKELLDRLQKILSKKEKRLKITNANKV